MYYVAYWGGQSYIVWHSGEGRYVLCGIVGRAAMYCVAYWGGQLCIVWHIGEDGCVSFGIVGRTGMCPAAQWGGGGSYVSCGIV